jgi:CMP-N-acetylneuraminic acid synthetase
MAAHTLAIILARAGSKGLANKNGLMIAGQPIIAYTIADAKAASHLDAICVTTDLPAAAEAARVWGVFVVDRPAELATDEATVDSAARHAVMAYERVYEPVTHVAILYANVPLRSRGVIDQTIEHAIATGADSVRSLRRIEKQHPDWLHRLEDDRMVQYRRNAIYRRQDLEPLFYHDGAVAVVTRASLFTVDNDDAHAFLGRDRRGILCADGPTIDVDSAEDFYLAEAILEKQRSEHHGPTLAKADTLDV